MLVISNLFKKYNKNKYYSVSDLSLNVNDGEIFGFLGRNGAGKSTTIKCILGILPYEKGSIELDGVDLVKNPNEVKQKIGFVSDERISYENLTGREYVNFIGNIYNVDLEQMKALLNEYAERFKMTAVLDAPIRTYSFGLKQKISVIAALIHKPKLWILDEPIIGLDPEAAAEIKQCMIETKIEGNIVFFSSHYIDMVEKLCDRVAIIDRGKLLEVIDMKEFKKSNKNSLEEYYLDLIKSMDK